MKKLSTLIAVLIVASFAFAQDVVFSPRSIVVNPKPSFDVNVELNKNSNGTIPTYAIGEQIRIGVSVSKDAYVYLFDIKSNGQVQQILPNRYDEAGRDNYVRANQTKYFPPRDASYTFNVEGPRGLDKVIAVASQNQLDTAQLAQFSSSGQFATSNLGEEGFAQGLSIVVKPIAQQSWVTSTTLFYVGEAPQQPAYATLAVQSRPSGARVEIDGSFVGYTPLRYGTRPGGHEVRVSLEGYETYRQSINVRPGDTATVDAQLDAVERTGAVNFNSTPSGADVFVNDRRVGTTPTSAIDLDAGNYQARFSLGGYDETYVNFTVGSGSNQTVSANMQRQAGDLRVTANVGGAQVFVDGNSVGTIPNGSGQITLRDLTVGNHELTVVAPGFSTFVTPFRIDSGSVTDLRVRQERR